MVVFVAGVIPVGPGGAEIILKLDQCKGYGSEKVGNGSFMSESHTLGSQSNSCSASAMRRSNCFPPVSQMSSSVGPQCSQEKVTS